MPWMFGCCFGWVLFWGTVFWLLSRMRSAGKFFGMNFANFISRKLAMVKSSPFQLLGGFTLLPRCLRSFSFSHVFIHTFCGPWGGD